ncbi:MAG TPA: helix-turn-helix domain-containing protein [Hyphomicrobiaceae bacterium]|jgi:DNA-binding HxlR family transcriptional regulator|nr:helix-turn-helix domain-containing protein [Hyphomicrobiaceae bacterium]
MTEGSYKQFCPVAMASEVLCTRWTMMLVRELLLGTSRFNDLRRGVPRMSPALLSKRLKDLEAAGIVKRSKAAKGPDLYEYRLTDAGRALKPVIDALGDWGHRWVTTEATLAHLDVSLLMWNMRRNIDPKPMPRERSVIQFIYTDLAPSKRNWWLIVEPGVEPDLCSVDPGHEVDLYVTSDLRTMTEVWMGYSTAARAMKDERLLLTGKRNLEASFQKWLGASRFAKMEKCVA